MIKELERAAATATRGRVTNATADGLAGDVTQATADRRPAWLPTRAVPSSAWLSEDAVREALATVNDPEIHRPITELGMVKSVEIGADGAVAVTVYLTVSGCPMRETITSDVTRRGRAGRGRHRASTSRST